MPGFPGFQMISDSQVCKEVEYSRDRHRASLSATIALNLSLYSLVFAMPFTLAEEHHHPEAFVIR